MQTPTLQDVLDAEPSIARYVSRTPLARMLDAGIYLKLESLQVTGSFKPRGAFHHLLRHRAACRNGVITAASGNHGQAVAYAARELGLRAAEPGEMTWACASRYVDEFFTVSEEEIWAAMRRLLIEGKIVAEPSGAVAPAMALRDADFRRAVVVNSGGNLDPHLPREIVPAHPCGSARGIHPDARHHRKSWMAMFSGPRAGRSNRSLARGVQSDRGPDIAMALVLSFHCGRCGKDYAVYYPKAVVYPLYGQGTPEQGAREDAEEEARGALDALRKRAESSGRVWVNAGNTTVVVCECGKSLNLDLAAHPRVPQRKPAGQRQTGLIQFGTPPRKNSG